MTTVTLTLNDGTQLTGLKVNGNMLCSETEITREMIEGKTRHISITPDKELPPMEERTVEDCMLDEVIGEFDNMYLSACFYYEETKEYMIGFAKLSPDELRERQTKADIEYIAMMSGVEL